MESSPPLILLPSSSLQPTTSPLQSPPPRFGENVGQESTEIIEDSREDEGDECPTTGSNAVLGEHGQPTRIHRLTRVIHVPGLDCAPSTSPRGASTGSAHLLLQHITSPPAAATHSDRVCPCRRQRQQPYCPLNRVRDTWRQSIGPIVSAGYPTKEPFASGRPKEQSFQLGGPQTAASRRKLRPEDNPDRDRGEAEDVRRNATSVFDRLGRPGIYQRIGRERSVDKPTESHDRRIDHLQRQLDQLMGQQYGMEQVGTVDLPFTPAVMASLYPVRFKMPSVTSYDGSTDAVVPEAGSRIDRLLQTAGRLLRNCILGPKTRKLGASHLFGIKQGEAEMLKKYLERFDKAIEQVESCTDDTLIQAFREGVKDTRLIWTLAYDKPPTFAHLRRIVWRHAETDEYVRGRGLVALEQPRLPGRKTDRNQPDQNRPEKGKAAVENTRTDFNSGPRTLTGRFQQYTPSVTTIEHVLNQIELLIRDGHLREFRERIITPAGSSGRAALAVRQNPEPSNRTTEQSGSVSKAGRSSPGPRSTYHLASNTSPVAIPIRYRLRPPITAAHHIATRRHPL
ncbi:hypothetical protein TIFTF001_015527 [Ficus carica]|uniref:Uncharacterized protein n=1 Tax=Ficus carica TaxID=3494 RepID=A0AA88A602_FICCA|nr:hypothetical protein TIFTF001_015527 [Ficus carica]